MLSVLHKINPADPHNDPERSVSLLPHFIYKETEALQC